MRPQRGESGRTVETSEGGGQETRPRGSLGVGPQGGTHAFAQGLTRTGVLRPASATSMQAAAKAIRGEATASSAATSDPVNARTCISIARARVAIGSRVIKAAASSRMTSRRRRNPVATEDVVEHGRWNSRSGAGDALWF